MIAVVDTVVDVEYRGRISKGIALVRKGFADEIITRGGDFKVVKYENRKQGDIIRSRALRLYDSVSIRYIIVRISESGSRTCFAGAKEGFSDNFKRALFFTNPVYAEQVIETMPKVGYFYSVEEYMYYDNYTPRNMRVYYNIRGLCMDKPIFRFIKQQIQAGLLTPRFDHNNKAFIYISDLLMFKDMPIDDTDTRLTLRILLHDGLIAFNAVSEFVNRYDFDTEIPELKNLHLSEGTVSKRVFYNLGDLFYSDKAVQDKLCSVFGLDDWR